MCEKFSTLLREIAIALAEIGNTDPGIIKIGSEDKLSDGEMGGNPFLSLSAIQ